MLSAVEHSSVRDSSERAADVVVVPVDEHGHLLLESLDESLSACTARGEPAALVHCQSANHEVATVQPVAAAVEVAHRHGALVHVEAAWSRAILGAWEAGATSLRRPLSVAAPAPVHSAP